MSLVVVGIKDWGELVEALLRSNQYGFLVEPFAKDGSNSLIYVIPIITIIGIIRQVLLHYVSTH